MYCILLNTFLFFLFSIITCLTSHLPSNIALESFFPKAFPVLSDPIHTLCMLGTNPQHQRATTDTIMNTVTSSPPIYFPLLSSPDAETWQSCAMTPPHQTLPTPLLPFLCYFAMTTWGLMNEISVLFNFWITSKQKLGAQQMNLLPYFLNAIFLS